MRTSQEAATEYNVARGFPELVEKRLHDTREEKIKFRGLLQSLVRKSEVVGHGILDFSS